MLIENAREIINLHFDLYINQPDYKITPRIIGEINELQFVQINYIRRYFGYPEFKGRGIYFIGKHLFESRHRKDSYSKENIFKMIKRSIEVNSFPSMDFRTINRVSSSEKNKINLVSTNNDKLEGNSVQYVSVFVFSQKRENGLELYNIIPYGDNRASK